MSEKQSVNRNAPVSRGILVTLGPAELRELFGHEVGVVEYDMEKRTLRALVMPVNAGPIGDTQPFPVMTLGEFQRKHPKLFDGQPQKKN